MRFFPKPRTDPENNSKRLGHPPHKVILQIVHNMSQTRWAWFKTSVWKALGLGLSVQVIQRAREREKKNIKGK